MTEPLSRREWWVLSFLGCALLIAFALIWLAAPARAQEEDVEAVAAEAGVDPIDLAGASLTTNLPPREYLYVVGELARPQPVVTVWDRLAACESGGNWSAVSRSGIYRGGLQFDQQTWASYGGHAYASSAHLATRTQQITVAERLRAARGYQPWPVCGRRI